MPPIDQPIPDFSQSPQYAPGFQPQAPIQGIYSSYNGQPQQFSYQQNPLIAQQADAIAMQSMVNTRQTMVLAQQNLMNSMQTAMMGTMNAFSDITRRSSSMITNMSPVKSYNDILAPNQNWMLESSFRREAGYMISNGLGLDPYNSPLSRLIQGRRPEFLTEGEYGRTMRYASELRGSEFSKGLKGVGIDLGVSALMGLTGASLATSLVVPAVVGVAAKGYLNQKYAEHEDLLETQLYTTNKRVGLGQQYISVEDTKKMHGAFYAEENPFMARLFGKNAVGNLFRPDVSKLDVFKNASENGLLAYENLDADSLIKYISKISDTVEKFSRIGKVTREASQKLMGELKSSGIHGDNLLADFSHAAITSSVTGLDLQSLIGIKSQSARQASYLGYDTYSASSNAENILSGYAMMQANGMFKQKDISRLTQLSMDYSSRGPKDTMDLVYRFGSIENAKKYLKEHGGGSLAVGYESLDMANMPQLNRVHSMVDYAVKKAGKNASWSDILKLSGADRMSGELQSSAHAYWLGLEDINSEQVLIDAARRKGIEVDGYTSTKYLGKSDTFESSHTFFNREVLDSYSKDRQNSGPGNFTKDLDTLGKIFARTANDRSLNTMEDVENLTKTMQQYLPIDKNGKFSSNYEDELKDAYGMDNYFALKDRRFVHMDLLKKYAPTAFDKIQQITKSHDLRTFKLGNILSSLDKAGIKGVDNDKDATKFLNLIKSLGKEKTEQLVGTLSNIWEEGGFSDLPADRTTLLSYTDKVKNKMFDIGLDPNTVRDVFGDPNTLSKWFTEKGHIGAPGHLYNILKSLEKETYNLNTKDVTKEKAAAHNAHMSLDSYRRGYKAFDFLQKYVDDQGNVKREFIDPRDNEVSLEVKKHMSDVLSNLGDDAKKYFASRLPKTDIDTFARDLKSGNYYSDQLPAIMKRLSGIDGVEGIPDEVKSSLMKGIEAAKDPSTAAINTMNDLLTKIYNVMDNHPEKNKVPEQKK